MDEPIIKLLTEIRDVLLRIEAAQTPAKCSAADREILSQLLPGVGGMWGSRAFKTCEVLQDPALCAIANMNAHQLGGLLARAANDAAVISGLVVQKVSKKEHGVVLWQVLCKAPDPVAKTSVRVFNARGGPR